MNKYFFISVLIFYYCNNCLAQVPNNFSPGDPVSASQINSNFQYLYNLMMGNKIKNILICPNYMSRDNINSGSLFFYN